MIWLEDVDVGGLFAVMWNHQTMSIILVYANPFCNTIQLININVIDMIDISL
jgi:hypothetical protein